MSTTNTNATGSNRNPGGFRGYTNEQKTLRAKLAQVLKWTRDLKTNVMKQSCKALQNNQDFENRRQIVDQIHDDLDEYKRKVDRELGRIHDICDALVTDPSAKTNNENLRDEILEALRRSPTYSSLEQHMFDEQRPRIRVKPRERIRPPHNPMPRNPYLSAETLKRKASQPVALQLLDTTIPTGNGKRRPPTDPFKRSRSFTNVEHQETRLGMDYIEEDEDDVAWKPFGPKKSFSQTSFPSEQSNDEPPTPASDSVPAATSSQLTETEEVVVPTTPASAPPPPRNDDDDSSDEEFDVAWQRRAKNRAPPPAPPPATPKPVETPGKRNVRFALSSELVEVDDQDEPPFSQSKDQNNNRRRETEAVISVIDIDDDENTMSINDSSSQLSTMSSSTTPKRTTTTTTNNNDSGGTADADEDDDEAQIIDDSSTTDEDDIIALSDDEDSFKAKRRNQWTSSEIQISNGNSQSQSMHNPYRVGIADPSLRSIFLPPPPSASQTNSQPTSGNRRNQSGGSGNRKVSPNKRATSGR